MFRRWFRSGPSPYQTPLAMIGVKPGQTVVVTDAGDAALAAQVGLITGLNGRTLVVDPDAGAASVVETAAAREGALLDFESAPAPTLPLDDGRADIVVLHRRFGHGPDAAAAVAAEAARVLRGGGRVIAIESGESRGRFARRSAPADDVSSADVEHALALAGFRATRLLANVDGVRYIEGVKPATRP